MGTMVDASKDIDRSFPGDKKITVVFALGGPGTGKSTQCANIAEHFGFTHLSPGDLLREESNSGSENGAMIQKMMKEGKIVPSEVVLKLLQKAMLESGNDKFVIDGFPRDEENRAAFENVIKVEPEFVLFFDCPEEEMVRRLLNRHQERDDDNIETIRKRLKVFASTILPVVEYYKLRGKVRKIDAAKPVDEVFEAVKVHFAPCSAEANQLGTANITTKMRLVNIISHIKWLLRSMWSVLTNILSKLVLDLVWCFQGSEEYGKAKVHTS